MLTGGGDWVGLSEIDNGELLGAAARLLMHSLMK
jgi:hypothetical protein